MDQSTEKPWVGCSECDCIFACYNGAARCIRLPPVELVNPLSGCKHVRLSITGPGSSGQVILKNLTPSEITGLLRICLLWNEANPFHAQPSMTIEEL